jgi:hypothetical protein
MRPMDEESMSVRVSDGMSRSEEVGTGPRGWS